MTDDDQQRHAQDQQRLETILAQAGTHYQGIAALSSRDVVPALHLASTYERGEDGLEYPGGFIYSRHANPTRSNLEAVLTRAEAGAEWTATFASGMAAANAILQAFGTNSFLVMPNDLYHGVRYLVHTVFGEWNLRFVAVDMTNLDDVSLALDHAFGHQDTTRVLLWMESPSNPLLQVSLGGGIYDRAWHDQITMLTKQDIMSFPPPPQSRWQTSPLSSASPSRPPVPQTNTSSASPT